MGVALGHERLPRAHTIRWLRTLATIAVALRAVQLRGSRASIAGRGASQSVITSYRPRKRHITCAIVRFRVCRFGQELADLDGAAAREPRNGG